jgi:hypothetical protein
MSVPSGGVGLLGCQGHPYWIRWHRHQLQNSRAGVARVNRDPWSPPLVCLALRARTLTRLA